MQIRNFETEGFVDVPFPKKLQVAVRRAEKSWQAFCALPDEIKLALGYSNNSAGFGYEKKVGEGPKGDIKENFDITEEAEVSLEARMQTRTDYNLVVRNFVDHALEVAKFLRPLVANFSRLIEKEFELPGFSREVSEESGLVFVRFIHYPGQKRKGESVAQPHVDQGGVTFHLFESAPGLECLNFSGEWVPMPVSKTETVVIPDMQMQLRSVGRLRALWHRVVANDKTAKSGRYSAVAFIHFPKTPKYNKEKYGRLQEMREGFNYHLEHKKFSRLFK